MQRIPYGNFSVLDNIVTRSVKSYPDEVGQNQNLHIEASKGIYIDCNDSNLINMQNDVCMSSNLVVENTCYMQNANIFRYFDNRMISYGFFINDCGKLDLYKFDSKNNISTIVNSFGVGDVIETNTINNRANEITHNISNINEKKNG